MNKNSTLYFSDGKKSIDFILVFKITKMKEEDLEKLDYFLESILKTGLDTEIDPFSADENISFVKIHASNDIIVQYSDICDIDLAYRSIEYRPPYLRPRFDFMVTPLTAPDPDHPVYKRAPASVSMNIPTDVTSTEKILVIYKMLCRIKFGPKRADYGIEKLINRGIILDAYPLHDSPYQWTKEGPLSDRQLLAKYWGNPRCWYKEQPMYLVEKYYGTEFAFYFAWLGYYVKMLIPAAFLSVICLTYGLVTINTFNTRSEEICNSDMIMCPRCHYMHCKYEMLNNSCIHSYLTYLFDNPATIVFSIIISFWSTIFMELWQRSEAVLQLQWDVKSLEHDTSMRSEYVEAAVHRRYSPITGENEPYIPHKIRVARYALTLASIGLLLLVMILATFGVMVYRITVSLMLIRDSKDDVIKENTQLIASTTGSFMSASFIFIFRLIYGKIAMILTNLESHRTQYEFDNSFIYKNYALAFTNNYSAVFYIAFFKGRFFTHPGDMSLWTAGGGIGSDICGPTGCILDLGVQLIFIMVLKIVVSNFVQIVVPLFWGLAYRQLNRVKNSDIPIYEKEYLMAHTERYFLVDEYMDMVIQYGFVVFFIAGFPLAPVLALINNFMEVRVDAYKITRSFRRPIPNKVTGLGAWFGILQAMTYLGVVTNALVIAFTSDFVPKELYRHQEHFSLKGFTNSTLSAYAIEDFTFLTRKIIVNTTCYYPGKRYPPEHERKYQLTTDFWFVLAIRFLVVIVFEHVVVFLKGILAYAIPDVPSHVTEQLAIQERKNREIRMKVLNEKYMEQRRDAALSNIVNV